MEDYKRFNSERSHIDEMLLRKDDQVKKLRSQVKALQLRIEGLEEEILTRDTLILAQRSEIKQSKLAMESRISYLENIVNSENFLRCTPSLKFL
mgnify:CR=1 FL=1